jgi:hypothetical protein
MDNITNKIGFNISTMLHYKFYISIHDQIHSHLRDKTLNQLTHQKLCVSTIYHLKKQINS